MTGCFITFEGVEGSGKTTQIALLRDVLEAEGQSVVVLREPGGDPVAEAIREVLLMPGSPVVANAELLLFLAARAQNTRILVMPALEAGRIVLCDRYADSTVAYQGHARGLQLGEVRRLNRFATDGLRPSMTVLLDLDPEVGLLRQADRNRMEQEPLDFHARVRAGYLSEAGLDPGRFVVISAAQTPQDVHRDVLTAARQCLSALRRPSAAREVEP